MCDIECGYCHRPADFQATSTDGRLIVTWCIEDGAYGHGFLQASPPSTTFIVDALTGKDTWIPASLARKDFSND